METENGIEMLIGDTITDIKKNANCELIFTMLSAKNYKMWHKQSCCETVEINDISGDLNDLIGVPVLRAEEKSNREDPPLSGNEASYTWTFYTIATIKGYVDIRWFGQSNGYYSESVSFELI